jgi:hypothetical protein
VAGKKPWDPYTTYDSKKKAWERAGSLDAQKRRIKLLEKKVDDLNNTLRARMNDYDEIYGDYGQGGSFFKEPGDPATFDNINLDNPLITDADRQFIEQGRQEIQSLQDERRIAESEADRMRRENFFRDLRDKLWPLPWAPWDD